MSTSFDENGLLESILKTSDLKDSVLKVEVHCLVETSCVEIVASVFAEHKTDET